MARTTLNLDRGALSLLRRLSESEGRSMGAVASELILASAEAADAPPSERQFRLPTYEMGEPRVDLEDKEALRIALEESDERHR